MGVRGFGGPGVWGHGLSIGWGCRVALRLGVWGISATGLTLLRCIGFFVVGEIWRL